MSKKSENGSDDEFDGIVRGADKLAELLKLPNRRSVYHLAARSRLPVFRLGSMLCARRKVLLEFITEQEQRQTINHRKQNHPVESSGEDSSK